MKFDNIIPSTLKVTAKENDSIQQDLKQPDPTKTLAQIIHEEEDQEETKNS